MTSREGAGQVVMSSCSISTESQIRGCREDLGHQLAISRKNSEAAVAGSHWNVTEQTH